MKLLFIGRYDWANVCNRIVRAMNTTAGEVVARVFTERAHPFGYQEDMVSEAGNHRDLWEWAAAADWILTSGDGDYGYFGSLMRFLPLRRDVMQGTLHAGSAYRAQSEKYNQVDKAMNFAVRFLYHDLYRLSSADPAAVPYFSPPGLVAASLHEAGTIRIGHAPSSRETKGTEAILPVLQEFSARAEVDVIENVSYAECDRRRSRCQIVVDHLVPTGFGAAATEAMAQGCAVISNMSAIVPAVWGFFPRPPIIHVETPDDLRVRITELLDDPDLLRQTRQASLDWIRANAAPKPLAEWWWKHLR
jgi:hypothetical protein